MSSLNVNPWLKMRLRKEEKPAAVKRVEINGPQGGADNSQGGRPVPRVTSQRASGTPGLSVRAYTLPVSL